MARQATPLSRLILDHLTREHFLTVPQLVEHLEKSGTSYNKTSVYRALEKLVNDNELCKLNFGTNDIVYELRDAHHDHLVCSSCGKISAVECSNTPNMIGEFEVDHHHLTYFGTCGECIKKN